MTDIRLIVNSMVNGSIFQSAAKHPTIIGVAIGAIALAGIAFWGLTRPAVGAHVTSNLLRNDGPGVGLDPARVQPLFANAKPDINARGSDDKAAAPPSEMTAMSVDDVLQLIEKKRSFIFPNWQEIGFDKSKRHELLKKIISEGEGCIFKAGKRLLHHILADTIASERLELFREIMNLGSEEAKILCEYLFALDVDVFSADDLLHLLRDILNLHCFDNDSLATDDIKHTICGNLQALGLNKFSMQQRIELGTILATKMGLREAVVFQMDNLNLSGNNDGEKLTFYLAIRRGSGGIDDDELLAIRIQQCTKRIVDYLRSSKDFSERLARYNEIGCTGPGVSEFLEENYPEMFDEVLQISNRHTNAKDRLAFYLELVATGETAARLVAKKFDRLGIDSASAQDTLPLCRAIVSYGDAVKDLLIANYTRLQLARKEHQQLYIDLWRPLAPSDGMESFASQALTGNVSALINLLITNKEEPLDSGLLSVFRVFLSGNPSLKQLVPLFDRTLLNRDKFVQLALMDWIVFTARMLYEVDESKAKLMEETQLPTMIFNHTLADNRYEFTRQLIYCIQNNPEELRGLVSKCNHTWTKLASITTVAFKELQFDITAILSAIDSKRFKEDKKFNSIVQLLREIRVHSPFSEEQYRLIQAKILETFKRTTKSRDIESIVNGLNSLTNILRVFGKETFLTCLKSKEDPVLLFLRHFQEIFDVKDRENFATNYQTTFAAFRDQMALFTYLGSVMKLPEATRNKVLTSLNEYVNSVLDGNFNHIRYQTEKSNHLQKVFASRADIRELWMQKSQPEVVSFDNGTKECSVNYMEFFREKILIHKHLDPQLVPRLVKFFEGGDDVRSDRDNDLDRFQNLCIDLCTNRVSISQFLAVVQKMNGSLDQLQNDFLELQPKKVIGRYVRKESDDACDLLLIGTEVPGSCQHVARQGMNRCLMSYAMNGELKAIVLTQNDKIVARSVMRLMMDEANGAPVILLERVYSSIPVELSKKVILECAMEKAKMMRVPLVSVALGHGEPYKGRVLHLGGYAPFLYSDAAGGIEEGPFEVLHCRVLYQP